MRSPLNPCDSTLPCFRWSLNYGVDINIVLCETYTRTNRISGVQCVNRFNLWLTHVHRSVGSKAPVRYQHAPGVLGSRWFLINCSVHLHALHSPKWRKLAGPPAPDDTLCLCWLSFIARDHTERKKEREVPKYFNFCFTLSKIPIASALSYNKHPSRCRKPGAHPSMSSSGGEKGRSFARCRKEGCYSNCNWFRWKGQQFVEECQRKCSLL